MSLSSLHTQRPVAAVVAVAFLAVGCADMSMSERQKGTAIGAGAGAAGGAVIGSMAGSGNAGKGALIGGVVGAVAGNLWSKRQEDRRKAMEQATQGTGVQVSRTADNQLKLNVPNDISFDVNSSAIKPQLRTVLDQFASSLQGDPNTQITIVGHTDSTGGDALNNRLSMDRAQSVRDYLAARGVAPQRIRTDGRGEHQPIADNNTEAGRAQNRRVEIFVAETGAG